MPIQAKLRFYTVLEHLSERDPDGRVLLVKDGFCWPAFLLGLFSLAFLWFAYHRMWVLGAAYFILVIAIAVIADQAGFLETAGSIVALAIALLVGFEANAVRAWAMRRRGYREIGTVAGTSLEEAERAYFEEAGAQTLDDALATPAPSAAPAWGPARGGDEVIGLFPQPGGR